MSVKEYPVVHGKGRRGSDVEGKCAVDMVPKVWDNVNFFMLYHTYLLTYLPTY